MQALQKYFAQVNLDVEAMSHFPALWDQIITSSEPESVQKNQSDRFV